VTFFLDSKPMPLRRTSNQRRSLHLGRGHANISNRRVRFEPLEDRRLLSITVNTLVDENDGIGVGTGTSLREAISAAVAGDTINFSVTGTINLSIGGSNTTKSLLIDKNLTIQGPGADLLTIQAFDPTPTQKNGDGSRIFTIDDGNSASLLDVTISDLTLTGGDVTDGGGGAIKSSENLVVANCAIIGNNAASGSYVNAGGGILSSASLANPNSLTIRGSTLSGNSTFSEGGAVRQRYGQVTVEDSTISNNTARTAGAGMSAADGKVSVTIIGSTFSNNTLPTSPISSSTEGGAIFCLIGNISITSSNFNGNTASQGGAIFSNSGIVSLTDTTLSHNTANSGGGGMYHLGGELTLANCIVKDNVDGGIYHSSGALLVTGSTFSGNSGSDGAAILATGAQMTVVDSSFNGNSGYSRGGAIYLSLGGTFAMYGGEVVNNSVNSGSSGPSSIGGGIFLSVANLVATISGVTFSGNSANTSGGAVYFTNGTSLQISNCTLQNNTAKASGGGVYLAHGGLIVDHSQFLQNKATNTTGTGGAIATNTNTNLSVTSSTISGNTAGSSGGGIYASSTSIVNLTGSVLANNTAQGAGGALCGGSNTTVTSCTIDGNSASAGGGISMPGGTVAAATLRIESSAVTNNHSTNAGGGVWARSVLQASHGAFIVNSTLSGNAASTSGGGIYNQYGLVSVENSTITKNTAAVNRGSGIATRGTTAQQTVIASSIVAGNVNSDLDLVGGSQPVFQSNGYNLLGIGNAIAEFNSTGDQTNIADPMLGPLANNGGPTKTHAPLTGSPAIDAGDPAALEGINGVPLFDGRGVPFGRVFDGDAAGGARIDIGAFEVQPQTPPPIFYGDFNLDGIVNAADYVVWRVSEGQVVSPYSGADGTGNGLVGPEDYALWRANFGAVVPATPATGSGQFVNYDWSTAIGDLQVEAPLASTGHLSQSPPVGLGISTIAAKTRLLRQPVAVSFSSRDFALAAWPAIPASNTEFTSGDNDVASSRHQVADSENYVDAAFATLSNTSTI
jgi:predicted outer membrane repeat protein